MFPINFGIITRALFAPYSFPDALEHTDQTTVGFFREERNLSGQLSNPLTNFGEVRIVAFGHPAHVVSDILVTLNGRAERRLKGWT